MIMLLMTCHKCGIQRAQVFVKSRMPQQDIVEWMERSVTPTILAEHNRRSPACDAGFDPATRKTKLDIAIPLPDNDDDSIGQSMPEGYDPKKHSGDFMKSKRAN
jgi:hypothetical protein